MAGMNDTPRGERTHIAFFGLRNAGKSTLVNALTGQDLAIVSDRPGTTTDPVSKAMEILPLGPCLLTDTAGLDDDDGALGAQRVKKTLDVLATADVAVWVASAADAAPDGARIRARFDAECAARRVAVLEYRRGGRIRSSPTSSRPAISSSASARSTPLHPRAASSCRSSRSSASSSTPARRRSSAARPSSPARSRRLAARRAS